jgi:hypothetical protein
VSNEVTGVQTCALPISPDEMPLYMECMNNVPLSTRVRAPRPCDGEGRDVRDGCILTGVFLQCRKPNAETPHVMICRI